MKSIAVFCGSSPGAKEAYTHAAENLGQLLAARNIGLVYGAGDVGLMGAVANAALGAGGKVTGVIPQFMNKPGIIHKKLTECIIVDTMHERKRLMAEHADGFIALPGGYGTLEELFEALAWTQLAIHQKPCGLLNVCGFFDGLLAFLRHASEERFIKEKYLAILSDAEDPETLLDKMANFTPPKSDKWMDRK